MKQTQIIQNCINIAENSITTFFGKGDEKSDKIIANACYEMKCEIVDNLAKYLIKVKKIQGDL